MKFNAQNLDQPLDASLGLIFRLNGLWSRADDAAMTGKFFEWDAILDRIFCNLLYREGFIIIKDDDGNITKVKLDEKDKDLYRSINQHVKKAKREYRQAKNKKDYVIANDKLYQALMIKDVGLRKLQHKLKIYFREKDSNPARAMWGGS
jgi:hypothetical protein